MANFSGNGGEVYLGANKVAEVLDWSLTEGAAIIDNSALDDTADTHLVGSTNWSATINAFWDDTDTNGQVAMTAGASVALNLRPEGTGVGDAQMAGTATIESLDTGLSRNGMVTATFNCTGNGVLSKAVQ